MSSFMRTIERNKVRTAMEDQKIPKKNKKLKVWFDSYNEKKHEYLVQHKNDPSITRKEYEKRIRRKG